MTSVCHVRLQLLISSRTFAEPIKTEDNKLFTPVEIRDAIKRMHKNKAPGKDSITSIRVLFKYVEITGGQFGYLLVQYFHISW